MIEKGAEIGNHALSGAVLDPRAFDELDPEWRSHEVPVEAPVARDELWYLTPSRKNQSAAGTAVAQ